MIFEQIPIGGKKNVAYIVGDEKSGEVATVDVGYKHKMILDRVTELRAQIKYILATHRHRDHIGCATKIKRETDAPIAAFKTIPIIDIPLDDGDELQLGDLRIEVLHTPGHTSDSICFLINHEKLLAGDTLYVGRASRSSPDTRSQMKVFFDTLHDRVMKLEDEIEVWPGHDVGKRSSSTIGKERRTNSVLAMDFDEFWARRWDGKKWTVPAG